MKWLLVFSLTTLSSLFAEHAYQNNLKNRFLAASAFPQNLHAHSRLARGQWSLAPHANFEEPPCQIPDSSSYFGITVGPRSETIIEEEEELESAGIGIDRFPPIYYSSAHHWLTAVTILNNSSYTLELEDGSVWKISSYDGSKALNWRENDPLTITQNNRWFSRHEYRIINKSNGTSVEATLFLGPIELGEFSRFIIGIDYSCEEILLNDMTRWEISSLDSSIFQRWALDDYIIIGTNSNTSIWDSGSDVLLINVNQNNCVRARQF